MPYGKKRLKKMLEKVHNETMPMQKKAFLDEFEAYRDGMEVNDDVTVVGLRV